MASASLELPSKHGGAAAAPPPVPHYPVSLSHKLRLLNSKAGSVCPGTTKLLCALGSTSPNPCLELTLGVQKNHKKDQSRGELDFVSSDCQLTPGSKCPESRGHTSTAIPVSFPDQQAMRRPELATGPRISLAFCLLLCSHRWPLRARSQAWEGA